MGDFAFQKMAAVLLSACKMEMDFRASLPPCVFSVEGAGVG